MGVTETHVCNYNYCCTPECIETCEKHEDGYIDPQLMMTMYHFFEASDGNLYCVKKLSDHSSFYY